MNAYAQPAQEQRSRAVANAYRASGRDHPAASQLFEARPEALAQRRLDETLNRSPRVRSQMLLQSSLDRSPRAVAQAKLAQSLSRPCCASPQMTERQAMASDEVETARGQLAPVQRRESPRPENRTGLPEKLKAGIESLSGIPMDDVRVNFNSPRPAQFFALAITQGKQIDIGPGQERHLPHEAWHVAQQEQGRVRATTQMHGAALNTDSALEREADVMGARASTLAGSAAGHRRPPLSPKSSPKSVGPQPVGQLFPWELLPALGGTYSAFVLSNYLRQQEIKNFPDRYRQEVGRRRAVYETWKYRPGQAGHVMHWPVSLFHLLAGDVGSSDIGRHYAQDIPHLMRGPDTDANLKSIGRIETHQMWNKQKKFLPYYMGQALDEESRARSLMWFRDMHRDNAQNPRMLYRWGQSLMTPRPVGRAAYLLPATLAALGIGWSASQAYKKYRKKEEE